MAFRFAWSVASPPGRWCGACSLAAALFICAVPAAAGQEQALEDGLREMATAISQTLRDGEIRKIAVVEFQDLNGYVSTLGPFIAEELITELFSVQPGQFTVVERRQLEKVLAEQELSTSGLFDSTTIAELGSILGIEAIVTGSIADLGTSLKLNCRVISVESARVFAAASVRVAKDEMVTTLLRQTAAPAGSAGSERSSEAPPVFQSSEVFHQTDTLRVTVVSIGAAEVPTRKLQGWPDPGTRYRITLGLQLENLSSSDLLLAIAPRNHACAVTLVTSSGLSAEPVQPKETMGLPCVPRFQEREREQYARLAAKSRSAVTVTFHGEAASLGSLGSVGAELLQFEDGEPTKLSVGLSGISLPTPE